MTNDSVPAAGADIKVYRGQILCAVSAGSPTVKLSVERLAGACEAVRSSAEHISCHGGYHPTRLLATNPLSE